MKSIITTVGVSIFAKYIKDNEKNNISNFQKDFKDLEGELFSKFDDYKESKIKRLREKLEECIYKNASAEIQTIYKIIEDSKKLENKDYKIILLTTDTILSNLAAEIIQTHLEKEKFPKPEIRKIDNLLVSFEHLTSEEKKDEKEKINSGFNNLIKVLDEIIIKERPENCILNISGGYKALIPFTTIIGQLYKVPLMYMYEDSNTLVTIDPMPINFDMGIAELYMPYLEYTYLENPDIIPKLALTKLKQLRLVKEKENGQLERGIMGMLLKIYFDGFSSKGKKTFGFFIEYKLFEYFSAKPYKSLDNASYPIVKMGEKIKSKDNPNEEDIDLILNDKKDTDEKKTIFVEIKSLFESRNEKEVIERLRRRVQIAKDKNWNLKDYILVVYFPIFETIQNTTNIYKEYKKEALSLGIDFRVFYSNVPLINDQINYQSFLQNKIEKLDELTLYDEVMESLKPITNQAIELIVKTGNPSKVYLFGSAARRQLREDSDLDFYIIEESTNTNKIDAKKYYSALRSLERPKDIIVRTLSEFEENKSQMNTVEYEVFHEGIVLYEK